MRPYEACMERCAELRAQRDRALVERDFLIERGEMYRTQLQSYVERCVRMNSVAVALEAALRQAREFGVRGRMPPPEWYATCDAALRAAGRVDEPQVSAAEPPLKAVEIPAIPDSKG